ncbi:AAA family ATPase [Streptomyces sp. NPDC051320]|uniref:helix-turn-helix transcriptional regulator n=1 Tax=Streptomyces sp. NPDC051320 TaxID=3154644 RepID=UPI00344038CA
MTALRERRAALELLSEEAAAARAGSGRLVLLRGATGTGRTALLDAAAALGAEQGMRVLRARCAADDPGTGTPFAAIRQLLDSRPDGGSEDDIPRTTPLRELPDLLWERLLSYADDSPLLVAVDDAHLADADSRRWLTYAARRLDPLPVLLVVTERGQYDIRPPAPGLAHALSPSLVRVHALAPLSQEAAADVVRASAGPDAPDPWVHGCVRASAGSPLLLRALLDDLRAVFPDGPAPAGLPDSCAELYPGAFVAAVTWWLESAGPGSIAVARTLAELEDLAESRKQQDDDSDGIDGLLGEVTGTDPARVTGWITAMVRLGLLLRDPAHGRPRFAHPLLREAVLDGWPRPDRQAMHRAAAEVRRRRGHRVEAVAAHLLRAPAVGAQWATDALADAARNAARDDRPGDAADFLRRALDEPLTRAHRAAVLTELGSVELCTVRSAGIPRLTEALRLQDLPRNKVKAAVLLGTALAHRGEAHAAFAMLRDIDDGLPDDPVLTRSVRAAALLLSDHDRETRQLAYTRLRQTTERSPHLLGPAEKSLLLRYEVTAGLLSADRAMQRLGALLAAPEDPVMLSYLLLTAAAVAQWADRLDEADRLIQRGLDQQRTSHSHLMRRALVNTRMDTLAARGRHAPVLAYLDGQGLPGDQPGRRGPSNFHAHALMALVEAGHTAEAHRLAASVSLHDAHDHWEVNRFLYARGVLRAATGDPAAALDDFLECGRRQSAREVMSPVVTPWRSAAAECRLALGRPQAALALAEEEHRLATVWGTPRVLGRALRTLGEATGGRRGLELTGQAVRTLRDGSRDATGAREGIGARDGSFDHEGSGSGATFHGPDSSGDGPGGAALAAELVPALLAHGRQLIAAGRRAHARPLFREAAATAERLGAVRLRAAADRALRDSGARPRDTRHTGASALTGSEARIAALAADGSTNAQIAELLHLARRTVETHLTSAYRKLDIRRRAELPAALSADGGRHGEGE